MTVVKSLQSALKEKERQRRLPQGMTADLNLIAKFELALDGASIHRGTGILALYKEFCKHSGSQHATTEEKAKFAQIAVHNETIMRKFIQTKKLSDLYA